MAAAAGLVLAIVCIAIVALALGLAVASWGHADPTWAPRLARGAAVTVGTTCLLLSALHPIAQALP
jgi:hypothetical protein